MLRATVKAGRWQGTPRQKTRLLMSSSQSRLVKLSPAAVAHPVSLMSRSTLTGLNTSSSEREYVALGVELGMRGDGRGRLDYRAVSVQAGVLAQVELSVSP